MWKIRSSSFPFRPGNCRRRLRCPAGFTLVELLVSMAILSLIVLMYAQVIQGTSSTISRTTAGMDVNQAATVALDRLGNSLRNMVTTGSGTLVVVKNNTGSDGLAMVTNERVRNRPLGTNTNVVNSTGIRCGVCGYCVINASDSDTASTATVPMLHWGDGTVTYTNLTTGNTTYVQGQPSRALSSAATDVFNRVTGNAALPAMLQFSPISPVIFRFEVCFLLSDGTVASGGSERTFEPAAGMNGGSANLPRNRNFITNDAYVTPVISFDSTNSLAPVIPVPFSAADSDAAASPAAGGASMSIGNQNINSNGQNIYVRAVIVGIATLDAATLRRLSPTQITSLASASSTSSIAAVFPKVSEVPTRQTPQDAWDPYNAGNTNAAAIKASLSPPNFPAAVLQNIRFYQRYFYVN